MHLSFFIAIWDKDLSYVYFCWYWCIVASFTVGSYFEGVLSETEKLDMNFVIKK